jgi:hypothetical protein
MVDIAEYTGTGKEKKKPISLLLHPSRSIYMKVPNWKQSQLMLLMPLGCDTTRTAKYKGSN